MSACVRAWASDFLIILEREIKRRAGVTEANDYMIGSTSRNKALGIHGTPTPPVYFFEYIVFLSG